jgi:hypothetical protein
LETVYHVAILCATSLNFEDATSTIAHTHFKASPDSAHSTQKHPPNIIFMNPLLIYKSSHLLKIFAGSIKYSLLYGVREEKTRSYFSTTAGTKRRLG